MLSVVCRAENNRYYLHRGVEVRPGYLARWLEFNVIDTDDNDTRNKGIIATLKILKDQQSKNIL